MKINRLISKYNHSSRQGCSVKYIVIHWVGAKSTARENANYFAKCDRRASAHYFVDADSIWQSVNLSQAAWHCGGPKESANGGKYYGKCLNANSIGIELCCIVKNGKTIVDPKAIEKAAPLVKKLMKQYNISASNVIRHYDVTGKYCPGGYTSNSTWSSMKRTLTGSGQKKGYTGAFPTASVSAKSGTKANIKRWQSFLKWAKFYTGKVDGEFGTKTKSATKAFQKKVGLSGNGVAGPKTIAKAKSYSI